MKRWVSFIFMVGMVMCLSAQSITLSGKVVDKESKESLAQVIVMLKTEDGKASSSAHRLWSCPEHPHIAIHYRQWYPLSSVSWEPLP